MEENENMTDEEEIVVAQNIKEDVVVTDVELNENVKRLKTDEMESGSGSGSVLDLGLISGNIVSSSNNLFPRATNSKTRNYRKSPLDQEETVDVETNQVQDEVPTEEVSDRHHRNLWYMNFEASNSSSSSSSENFNHHGAGDGDDDDDDDDNDNNVNDEPETNDNEGGEEDHESVSTLLIDSDSDSVDMEEPAVLSKQKPKHKWFMVPEVINRQMGAASKYQSAELFQRRCYGSLHSVQRLELMYKLEKHEGCVNSLNFHPNGKLLASGSDDLQCVIWDWPIGRPLLSFDTKHKGNVFQSKFLDLTGDLHIVTSARDGQVRLHQVSATEGVRSSRRLSSHRAPVHKLSVLHDQPHVVLSCGEDGCVFTHDIRDSKSSKLLTVQSMDDRKIALYSINSHPLDSHQFCVSGRDHVVRVYDQRKISPVLKTFFPGHVKKKCDVMGLHVTCSMYNYNGSEIVASYCDDDIFLFDALSNGSSSYVHCYQGHRNGATIKGVNFFGPKSEYIVSGSDCGNVFFWDKGTEAIVQFMLADDSGVVNALEPHPQLPIICTSGLDWDVKVWVPSHEHEPEMANLATTVRRNNRCRITERIHASTDINDSQMLWMLWRHLRTTERLQRYSRHGSGGGGGGGGVGGGDDTEASRSGVDAELTLSDDGSNSNSNSNVDSSDADDDLVRPLTCSPS